MMFIVFNAFVFVLSIWALKVSFGSSVTPRILGFFVEFIVLLPMDILSVVLYSAGSGVRRVHVLLSVFSER